MSRIICLSSVLVLCLILLQGQSVDAFQCYSCLTGCDDDSFDASSTSKVDCTTVCSKTKSNAGNVIRGCHPIAASVGCNDEKHFDQCFCNTELCNGATSPKIPVTVALLFALVSVIWKVLY